MFYSLLKNILTNAAYFFRESITLRHFRTLSYVATESLPLH